MKKNDAMLDRLRASRQQNKEPFWVKQSLPEPITIAVILYPGLLSEQTASLLTESHSGETMQIIASALAVTLVNLSLAMALGRLIATKFEIFDWREKSISDILQKPAFIVTVTIVSILVGVIWATIESNNVIYKIHITDRRSRGDLFSTAAAQAIDSQQWARVTTRNAGTYHGLLKYYDSGINGGLYLLGPKLELDSARVTAKLGPALSACGDNGCRIPIPCVDTGVQGVGAIFIPKSQITTVEFRPVVDATGPQLRYSCDLQLNAKK